MIDRKKLWELGHEAIDRAMAFMPPKVELGVDELFAVLRELDIAEARIEKLRDALEPFALMKCAECVAPAKVCGECDVCGARKTLDDVAKE